MNSERSAFRITIGCKDEELSRSGLNRYAPPITNSVQLAPRNAPENDSIAIGFPTNLRSIRPKLGVMVPNLGLFTGDYVKLVNKLRFNKLAV